MWRGIIVTIIAATLIVIAVCVFLATKRPSRPTLPPVTAQDVAAAQQRLDQALAQLPNLSTRPNRTIGSQPEDRSATTSGRQVIGKNVIVRISESDVNLLLAGNKKVQTDLFRAGVSDAQVIFHAPDQIVATATITRNQSSEAITVSGSLIADGNGKAAFEPKQVLVGMLPIPESSIDHLIKRESNRLLQSGLSHLPMRLQTVSITDHQLVLSGTRS